MLHVCPDRAVWLSQDRNRPRWLSLLRFARAKAALGRATRPLHRLRQQLEDGLHDTAAHKHTQCTSMHSEQQAKINASTVQENS